MKSAMFAPQQQPTQHDIIKLAFNTALINDYIPSRLSDQCTPLIKVEQFTPTQEIAAFKLLKSSRCRSKLKSLGIEFPTDKTYENYLDVSPLGDGSWLVKNLTKGTEYTVTEHGFRLDCTCDEYGNGYCKHRDAVVTFRNSNPTPTHAQVKLETNVAPIAQPRAVEVQPVSFNGIQFTDEQSNAIALMKDWWLNSKEPFFRLDGYAGTGKTTIIQYFIDWVLPQLNPINLFDNEPLLGMAAPTNKAVKVQRTNLEKAGLANKVEAVTCASLFALRPIKSEGKEFFVRDYGVEPAIDNYQLVILDEASMVSRGDGNNDGHWEHIKEHSSHCRFILMGDRAQLPPVGEAESIVFSQNCPSIELTNPVRYSGFIGELVLNLRDDLSISSLPHVKTLVDENKSGHYHLDRATWMAAIKKAVQSDTFLEDPNAFKILAWRNATVRSLNASVRKALRFSQEFVMGERVIANASWPDELRFNDPNFISNSDEGEIVELWEGGIEGWPVWRIRIAIPGRSPVLLPVLQSSAKNQFNAELDKLSKAKQWSKFWGLKRKFADIQYAYALTVHKSQGSTYKDVFVDLSDISKCRSRHVRPSDGQLIYLRNQLAYVAFTRPQCRLFVS